MKRLPTLALAIFLVLFLTISVSAEDPAVSPLPPGTESDNFDIVEWLTWVASPAAGALVAWFLERTGLSKYMEMLKPEARRNVALVISGAFGALACVLLSALAELPEGSTAVINALLAMLFSQLAHGRMVLSNNGN